MSIGSRSIRTSRAALAAAVVAVTAAACGGTSTAPAGPTATGGPGPDGRLPRPTDVGPGAPAGPPPVFPDDPFRASEPAATAERPFKLPGVARFAIGPKVDVYLIENHDLPLVSLDLSFAGGSADDPADKVGRAAICMAMLTEGTERLDKVAYNEALADLASSIGAFTSDDRQGVSMSTLKRNFDTTFALYREVLTSPGLRQVDFDRMIKRNLENLKQVKASPGSIAVRVADAVLVGFAHPLGRIVTEATLGKLTLEDCKRFHAERIAPARARLYVAGDVTRAELETAFAPLFATWKGAPKPAIKVPGPRPAKGRVFVVNVPGAAQSTVLLGHPGPKRTAPGYFATLLMEQVLGGSFSSRINMNLREDKGYSYGARAGFNYNPNFGLFTAYSSVRTDATAQSVIEMVREIEALRGARPPTATELERERSGAILALPADFATSRQTLGKFRELVNFGLPLDYYDRYVAKVKAVAPKQVAAAAKHELDLPVARILVVGDLDAPQIKYVPGTGGAAGKNEPLLDAAGKPVTLRQALADLLAAGTIGKGQLVELTADGVVVPPPDKAPSPPTAATAR